MTIFITEIQEKVLRYLCEYSDMNCKMPTLKNIREHFGWASDNAAYAHICALVKKGYVERTESGISIVGKPLPELADTVQALREIILLSKNGLRISNTVDVLNICAKALKVKLNRLKSI